MKVAKDKFEIDVNPCILWQYNDAKNLQRLLQGEYDFFDFCTNKFWQNYIDFIFNVSTASRTGLERWARIVGLPVHYAIETNAEAKKSNRYRDVRVNGRAYRIYFSLLDKHEKGTKFAAMTDDFLRRSIIARFFLLDSNGSCDAINKYLYLMFGGVEVGTGMVKVCIRERGENVAEQWEEIFALGLTRKSDASKITAVGDYYYSNGVSYIAADKNGNNFTFMKVPAELTKKKSAYDDGIPQLGWYYVDEKDVVIEPKVYCADVQYQGPYYWILNPDTGMGKYKIVGSGNAALPMEIYYYVRIGANTYESAVNTKYYPGGTGYGDDANYGCAANRVLCESGGFSLEEAYVATLLANQRSILPHPAGVRINGLDEDIPIAIQPSEFFSFELEKTQTGLENDWFDNSKKIASFDNAAMIG